MSATGRLEMIPLLAAVLLAGAAGAGPVLVSDACGADTTTTEDGSRCRVDKIDKRMRQQRVPAELKVEAEGKLYSVPEDVKLTTPALASAENWWEEFVRKFRELVNNGKDSGKGKTASSSGAAPEEGAEGAADDRGDGTCGCARDGGSRRDKDVRSTGEHSCQICFDCDHSTVMLPCGHGGLCWDCGLQVYALTEECPMCRTKIELLVQVDGEKRRYEGENEYVSAVCA